MKTFKLATTLGDEEMFAHSNEKIMNFLSWPLLDFQIIEFQKKLMQPTIHQLITKDRSSGRSLIETFLPTLKYYHQVACLTSDDADDLQSVDVLSTLLGLEEHYGMTQAIEMFFLENSELDFVWIELSDDLLSLMSMEHVNQFCNLFTGHGSMPILVLSYQNE
jgi:hypothetical protein